MTVSATEYWNSEQSICLFQRESRKKNFGEETGIDYDLHKPTLGGNLLMRSGQRKGEN